MAKLSNLTYGHDFDEVIDEIKHQLHLHADTELSPLAEAIMLQLLDEHRGLHHQDDFIFVTPGYALWVLFEIEFVDPTLAQLFSAIDDDDAVNQFDRRVTSEVFEVRPSAESELAESLRNRVFRLRVMDERMASELEALHTVRADGTLIEISPGITNVFG